MKQYINPIQKISLISLVLSILLAKVAVSNANVIRNPSFEDVPDGYWYGEGKRKHIVEPVFGQIKEVRGFRRFLLHGLENVTSEWDLICLTHNVLKLFRSGLMSKIA